MFEIINPAEHESHKDLIDSFLNDLRSHNPMIVKFFQNHKKSTFILAKENPNNIKGGALLLKKKVSSLYPQVRERLEPFLGSNEYVWAGTTYLQLHDDIRGHTFESLCKTFYKDLYEALITFGVQEKTSFICLTLDSCEQLSTDLMGFWPYVIEVRHRDSTDGFFHGVLALTGTRNETGHFWKSLGLLTRTKGLAV